MGQKWFDGYSADVEIFLLNEGKRYEVAQIGGGSLILREPAPILAGTNVTLVIRIDGHEVQEEVFLGESSDVHAPAVPFF